MVNKGKRVWDDVVVSHSWRLLSAVGNGPKRKSKEVGCVRRARNGGEKAEGSFGEALR